jgi:hypothetical protein
MTRADPLVAAAAAVVDENLPWMMDRLRAKQPRRWQELLGELYLFSVQSLVTQLKSEPPRDNARWLANVLKRFLWIRVLATLRMGYPKSFRKTLMASAITADEDPDEPGGSITDVEGREPPPEQPIVYSEALGLLNLLTPVCREKVLLRLDGHSATEVASRYGQHLETIVLQTRKALASLEGPALEAGYEPPSTDGSAAGNRKLERFPVEKAGLRGDPPREDLDTIIVERGPDDWTLAFHEREEGPVLGLVVSGVLTNTDHVVVRCTFRDGSESLHMLHKRGEIPLGFGGPQVTKIEARSATAGQKIMVVATSEKAESPDSASPSVTPSWEAPSPPAAIQPVEVAPAAPVETNSESSPVPVSVAIPPPTPAKEKASTTADHRFARLDELLRAGDQSEELHVLLYAMAELVAKGIALPDNGEISRGDLAGEMYAHALSIIKRGKLKPDGWPAAYVRLAMNRRAWEVVEHARQFEKIARHFGEAMHMNPAAFEERGVVIADHLAPPIEIARKAPRKAARTMNSLVRSRVDEETRNSMRTFFVVRIRAVCEQIEEFPPDRRSEKLSRLYGILDGLQETRRQFLGTYSTCELPRIKFTKSTRIVVQKPVEALRG